MNYNFKIIISQLRKSNFTNFLFKWNVILLTVIIIKIIPNNTCNKKKAKFRVISTEKHSRLGFEELIVDNYSKYYKNWLKQSIRKTTYYLIWQLLNRLPYLVQFEVREG